MDDFLATTLQYSDEDLKEVNDFLWGPSICFLEWAFWMEVLGQDKGAKKLRRRTGALDTPRNQVVYVTRCGMLAIGFSYLT